MFEKLEKRLERSKSRSKAVPKWLSIPLVIAALLLPIYWIFGTNTPFDFILAQIVRITGPDQDLIHLLALLLTMLFTILPVGIFVQLLGAYLIMRRDAKKAD